VPQVGDEGVGRLGAVLGAVQISGEVEGLPAHPGRFVPPLEQLQEVDTSILVGDMSLEELSHRGAGQGPHLAIDREVLVEEVVEQSLQSCQPCVAPTGVEVRANECEPRIMGDPGVDPLRGRDPEGLLPRTAGKGKGEGHGERHPVPRREVTLQSLDVEHPLLRGESSRQQPRHLDGVLAKATIQGERRPRQVGEHLLIQGPGQPFRVELTRPGGTERAPPAGNQSRRSMEVLPPPQPPVGEVIDDDGVQVCDAGRHPYFQVVGQLLHVVDVQGPLRRALENPA